MPRLALLLTLILCSAAWAQSTQPTTSPADVKQALQDLGADDLPTREAAAAKIAAMEPSVLPQLREALDATQDPEIRTALQVAIVKVQRNDPNSATLVSLHVKEGSPKTAVEDLAKQANVPLRVWPDWVWRNMKKNVTIDAEDQPLWVVLMDVCSQAGLRPQFMGGRARNEITLADAGRAKTAKPPQVFHDKILFLLQSAQRTHVIDYASSDGRRDTLSISLQALVDPKLPVLKGPSALNVLEATDENGNSLLSGDKFQPENNLRASPWGASWLWDLNISLKYVPTMGTKLKVLKTEATFVVADGQDVWEVDVNQTAPSHHPYPGGQYTIDSIGKNGDGYEVKISVDSDNKDDQRPPGDVYNDYNLLQMMVKIVDTDGKPYQTQGGGGGGGMGHSSYSFRFSNRMNNGDPTDKPGVATKLVMSIPKAVKTVTVPVEFDDLPIP